MNPATGTHCLRVLREFLGLSQTNFAKTVEISPSMIHKLENGTKNGTRLTTRTAEQIARFTGISVAWLLRNDPAAPLIDSAGNRYTENHYLRSRARAQGLITPGLGTRTMVRMQLLQSYAKARALFDRPEMRPHFLRYVVELELLRGRFEDHALYPEGTKAGDLIDEEARLLNPDTLLPSVIADARKCREALEAARLHARKRELLGAFEPAPERPAAPVRQTKAQQGRELVRKRIRESVAERRK
jgi:transcriptional regulator with XRE-family HTH domain